MYISNRRDISICGDTALGDSTEHVRKSPGRRNCHHGDIHALRDDFDSENVAERSGRWALMKMVVITISIAVSDSGGLHAA